MGAYWDDRYGREGKIWGTTPSVTAGQACREFRGRGVRRVLVPGAGYGRNAALFARAGFDVTGVEVSAEAVRLAEGDGVRYIPGSFLEVDLEADAYDAVYCHNVLHLFLAPDRRRFVARCAAALRAGGLAFFAVFSDEEPSYGKGRRVEADTYESKPGRPVHYFSERDLRDHLAGFDVLEIGTVEEPEEHGEEGPHVHRLRFVLAGRKG
ncbi:MAG TPA: class I SAM-dependent methyltransferase [Methanocella sp.]|nr:class I SAM-dependent methyltransferase [Methanocella sp.]